MPDPEVVELQGWHQTRDAYRVKDLRQAMYTEGAAVMANCLLDLHGPEHRERRRLENRLFRRDVFAHWEQEVLGRTVQVTLAPFVQAGHGDLLVLGYRSAMNLTATIGGIDQDPADAEQVERLYDIVKTLSAGATIVHSTRPKDEVIAEVEVAKEVFRRDFFEPSAARRRILVERFEAGEIGDDDLPKDVLTTLLRNHDRLDLPPDVLFREICFYLQAGAHSTANAFTHTVDELFRWADAHPADLDRARRDIGFVQRCVHESLRLNPASPVAWRTPLRNVELADGTELPEGSRVVFDLVSANCDPSVFGPDADRFDPHRELPDGVTAWGLSFGGGTHACIGAELDGGLEQLSAELPDDHLYGTVAVMAHAFLDAGGRPDPDDAPTMDTTSQRPHFSRYPVVFG